jgi:hypothetical protein
MISVAYFVKEEPAIAFFQELPNNPFMGVLLKELLIKVNQTDKIEIHDIRKIVIQK